MQDSSETRRLVEQSGSGDAAAFDRLFARHRDRLRQTILRRMESSLWARVDPSDVVQETQLEAFRRIDDYLRRRPMPFQLWLHKTALQRLSKIRHHHAKVAKRSLDMEVPMPDQTSVQLLHLLRGGSSPSRHAAKQELTKRVRQALASLSEADREILLMRYIEKFTNQEISLVLDVDPDAVSKRHGRALLRLETALRQEGIGESEL